MPSFASNEWMDKQVNRIHDLTDINLLRMAKEGMDATHKTMVWNLSQNCDRDTMGKLGLCSCLTPSGVPYIPNRGAPLVGEELLLLQGIPADDLILTKESEENLKDLAGNAMSTTVVGAVTLCALLVCQKAIHPRPESAMSNPLLPSIVPRPLNPASAVSVVDTFGNYQEDEFDLGAQSFRNRVEWDQFLVEASSSARMCTTEGVEEVLPMSKLMVCSDCGKTESRDSALPPRPFERHQFVDFSEESTRLRRTEPSRFRASFAKRLPTLVRFDALRSDTISRPQGVIDDNHWDAWISLLGRLSDDDKESSDFRLTRVQRSIYWVAHYTAPNGGRMECRITGGAATWLVFVSLPQNSPLEMFRDRPLARLTVTVPEAESSFTLLDGEWEVCLPLISSVTLSIRGSGEILKSWRNRLGLKGGYENEEQYQTLNISVTSTTHPEESFRKRVEGSYSLLPDCGGACGSLRKKIVDSSSCEAPLYLFLDSGRIRPPDDDRFVIATASHRTAFGEYREALLEIEPRYRPLLSESTRGRATDFAEATVFGQWSKSIRMKLHPVKVLCRRVFPADEGILRVPIKPGAWRSCPLITSCRFPMSANDDAFRQCRTYPELNLQKSMRVFESAFFATCRLPLPFSERWMALDRKEYAKGDSGDDDVCQECSPRKPPILFRLVRRSGRLEYIPVEDVTQAGVFERRLKNRPQPWIVRFSPVSDGPTHLVATIGCNPVSLCQRAVGHFPLQTAARRCALTCISPSDIRYDWRIVEHQERAHESFGNLSFTSNKSDSEAQQPPNFKLRLRPEQLRSLGWMLCQEASTEPFLEEEVEEAVLPNLNWRAEGRAKRPVLVRGGILADEVGYGKTALALALLDAAPQDDSLSTSDRLLRARATLIVVPPHLSGQWPAEVNKFLGGKKVVVKLDSLASLNSTSVKDIQDSDIVIVNFTLLSNDKYLSRLATLCGVDPSFVGNDSRGRRFESLYADCVHGMPVIVDKLRKSCAKTHAFVCKRAKENANTANDALWIESKKAAYKKSSVAENSGRNNNRTEDDPWGLSSSRDYRTIKCPPLEMFVWDRIVVDEFTYLSDSKNSRVLQVVKQLNSNYRWCLSGTPPHKNFNDISCLADLMGIHLGVDEQLPGVKLSMPLGGVRNHTGVENMTQYMEIRSLQWHERRHKLAQTFLDRFVRQNVAEIDEIPFEEHEKCLNLPPAERAIYLELDTHLKALGMDSKQALKSKKASSGDRYNRMQSVLKGSATGDEALLKYCCHFNYDAKAMDALRTIEELIQHREDQKKQTEIEIGDLLIAAFRQRQRVLQLQPDWASTKTEHGEVADSLALYLNDVESFASVTHGADQEIHQNLLSLVKKARRDFNEGAKTSNGSASGAADLLDDDEDEVSDARHAKKRKVSADSSTSLYDMKFALREHMHKVRALGKELCGRTRSLRYVKHIRAFRPGNDAPFNCPSCTRSGATFRDAAILSICGHIGCLTCLQTSGADSRCNHAHCSAHVNCHHIVSSATLGLDNGNWVEGGVYGHKLTTIVHKVKEIVDGGQDRLIVFCQFDDLIAKVMDALKDASVDALMLTGGVNQMVKAVSVFQKEKPSSSDPRVLLLKMDDEQSAGLNLTGLNHAVFVHPLLANSQVEYDAYETQAIGRIRRYGQTKTVHVWRYFANHTIDTDIRAKFLRK